ncbi:transporter mfs1 [Trichoderma asperellum]|uniref:Transporter mfs1 n=1 Tax=Trichoderma asperellum TaxID=101201 RepID=A0A6V8QIG7_TRIAP|nr:MFS general substrate transporter [Trichoderma asperelloides]GFP52264.1 transporter mfs1 [Trichoderma asperellum]
MYDLIRDAPLGQAIRFLSGKGLLKYPEEEAGFELPPQYTARLKEEKSNARSSPDQGIFGDTQTTQHRLGDIENIGGEWMDEHDARGEREIELQRTKSVPIVPEKTNDGVVLVDWYTADDPANPQNWSRLKRYWITGVLCTYTFGVYCGGPVYVASAPGVEERFGIGPVASSLGLALYVCAFGVGDLIFSPITEIPVVGRNHVYYLTYIVYWALSFAPPVINSFGGLLVLRFLLGFFGSPALANGGASVGDIYSLLYVPYGLCWWAFGGYQGPSIGPLIGGFAAQAKGWRWPMWEVVWLSSIILVLLLTLMPETSADNILLRRARRLRKLTGNPNLQSQSEINQRHISTYSIVKTVLIRPTEIMLKDPSIFFIHVYTAYFYAVFYTFFEVFPLVFPVIYGFNEGETGLAFVSCLIGSTTALFSCFAYLHFYMIPDNIKNGLRAQEHRLVPAIFGSIFLPVGLFIFAWTARESVHWIVCLIGVALVVYGEFIVMQSLFIYLPMSYPQYAASLFAGNSVLRSTLAGGAVLFSRPLFVNLGIARGVSLLAGISVAGIIGTTLIYFFGAKLRARSTFAAS